MRKLFVMLTAVAVLSLALAGCAKQNEADTLTPPMPMSGGSASAPAAPPSAADDM